MNCEKALEIAQNAQSFGNFLGIICIILFVFMIFFLGYTYALRAMGI